MAKIQVKTVEMNADVQVIFLNANFVSKSIKAQVALNNLLEATKTQKQHWDEDDKKWINAVDENNNPIFTHMEIDGEQVDKVLVDQVLPFLNELINAFEE